MGNIQLPAAHVQPREGAQDTLWCTLGSVSERQGNMFKNAGWQSPCVYVYSNPPEAAS